jgi:hypothetical protein
MNRLRAAGYSVVDRPRPRLRENSVDTNHGGVAVVSSSGCRLSPFTVKFEPSTFEFVCARIYLVLLPILLLSSTELGLYPRLFSLN